MKSNFRGFFSIRDRCVGLGLRGFPFGAKCRGTIQQDAVEREVTRTSLFTSVLCIVTEGSSAILPSQHLGGRIFLFSHSFHGSMSWLRGSTLSL